MTLQLEPTDDPLVPNTAIDLIVESTEFLAKEISEPIEYSFLSLEELATAINKEHRLCEAAYRAALINAYKTGKLLLQAKAKVKKLPSGRWSNWLEANCPFADRTAQNYMNIARNWYQIEKLPTFTSLGVKDALRILASLKAQKRLLANFTETQNHTRTQYILAKLGLHLGDSVWIALGDRSKNWENENFSDLSIQQLPILNIDDYAQKETVPYIDVIWFKGKNQIVGAFEIECTTEIYSGLLRLVDLIKICPNQFFPIYIVVPESRIKKFERELSRPSFAELRTSERCFGITIESLYDNWNNIIKWSDKPDVIYSKLAFRFNNHFE